MIAEPRVVETGSFSSEGAVPTPWETALFTLRRTPKFWLSAVRADGRPHVTPLLAVLALDGICFVTGASEQKSRNLHGNPAVVLTTGVNNLTSTDFVMEGIASLVEDDARRDLAAHRFEESLGWLVTSPEGTWHGMTERMRDGSVETWVIVPTKAFANADGPVFSQTRYVW